jgi:PhzF family phenazine biosynthesis protein
MINTLIHRLSAFTTTPEGGNPAGIWIGPELPDPNEMLAIAKEVGYSETAFLAPATGLKRVVRYYSPEGEVDFCGHATIAAGVLLGETHGEGQYQFRTRPGDVLVEARRRDGLVEASLTSVPTEHSKAPAELDAVLKALKWKASDVEKSSPPARAFAGAWHLIIAAKKKSRLDKLDYDFESLKSVMLSARLTTVQLIWRESDTVFHSRNPFPVGGIVEDPATGAAAAALGGYLRDAGLVAAPVQLEIRQGEKMGRPSLLMVEIPESGGIVVTGNAVRI